MRAALLWTWYPAEIMDTKELLEQVKEGRISVEEAEGLLRREPFEDMGFAKLDSHRAVRSGFPEVIFCSGKPDPFLKEIYVRMYKENGEVFGTRASQHQYDLVRPLIPSLSYDPVSRILRTASIPVRFLSVRRRASGPCVSR